jgi:hypothetical protein
MTKDAYFEMCEALGTEPVDDEIPIDFEDLYIDVQEAMGIYHKLRDEWDTMNGVYLGKNYVGLVDILELLDVPVEDRRTQYELIGIIDAHRSKAIADAKPKST